MKTFIFVFLVAFFTATGGIASGQMLLEENFAYSPGQLTDGGGGTNVSGGNWVSLSGTGNFIAVVAGTLSFFNYPNSGIGNSISIVASSGSAEDVARDFIMQNGAGTKVYASFLINVTNTSGLPANSSTTGDYCASLAPHGGTSPFVGRVSIRQGSVAGTVNFGIRATGSNASAIWAPLDYSVAATHLVIVQWELVAGTLNDVARLWLNPDLSGAEPAELASQTSASDPSDIGRLIIRQGNLQTPNATISGIRVGLTWASTPLPVQLVSFSARSNCLSAELSWSTATETECYGFEIERRSMGAGEQREWMKIGFVGGAGTSSAAKEYSYSDGEVTPGRYAYRIKQIDNNGTFSYYGNAEVEIGLAAKEFRLESAYPNPFNPSTSIEFALSADGYASLKVFNIIGQQVAKLFDQTAEAGKLYKVTFDASRLPTGVYFARLEAGSQRAMRKFLYVR
ncbi:MAG: T9SS type A sorting domain-containing protein [Bacteroidota bacterium]